MAGRTDTPTPKTLSDILRRERSRGFQNTAVIGGLDLFLRRWTGVLGPLLGDIASYSDLPPRLREEWATDTMRRINALQVEDDDAPQKTDSAVPPKTPRAKAAQRPQRSVAVTPLSLDTDVAQLAAVTKRNLPALQRMEISKIEDLLFLFPHRHNDFRDLLPVRELVPGEEQTVIATVRESTVSGQPRRRSTQAVLGDDTGTFRVIWFGQGYLAKQLPPGTRVAISGKPEQFRGRLVFKSPVYELLRDQDDMVHTGRLVPIYQLTEGLRQRTIRRIVKEALDRGLDNVREHLPDELKRRNDLMCLREAISQMHYPESEEAREEARRRLAFDELFLMQLAVIRRKQEWQEAGRAIRHETDSVALNSFLTSLPYTLTGAQYKVLDEIMADLGTDRPMSRLLQGDVGSGKTIVATAALLVAALNGYQGALMAPTEILAEQHFLNVTKALSGLPITRGDDSVISVSLQGHDKRITVGLLLGSQSGKVKRETREMLADQEIDIVIGTHALIQSSVELPRLSLAIVDEQHRFGVTQRGALRDKGLRPHLLAMSATPIPRSLALTFYGDLDVSTIDEMPPGRRPIRTRLVDRDHRGSAYEFVREEVREGRQAFIVFPLIDESDAIRVRAAANEFERLSSDVFPELRLGLLHGRMGISEKEEVMGRFQNGELDILLSTAVVEVGIDVPNASVMLIDGAERFGLAQLHQFRGRVGRGPHQSHCLLLSDAAEGDAIDRLKIIERVSDGFQLAEEDLRLRGPGDYFGTRQSGLPLFKVARITDRDILALARREATDIREADPGLSKEENLPLGARFNEYSSGFESVIS